MARITTRAVRNVMTGVLFLVLIVSLFVWYVRRDRVPWTVRIATGRIDGVYYAIGSALQPLLEESLNRNVEVISTVGSRKNAEKLENGEVKLAIVQGGTLQSTSVQVVTPLHREFVHVVVRKDSTIRDSRDLNGKKVALGEQGSGNRESAVRLLDLCGVEVVDAGDRRHPLLAMSSDDTIEAALVTSGLAHEGLNKALKSGDFTIRPLADAPAVALRDPYFQLGELPEGLYGAGKSRTPQVQTVATTSYLVAGSATSDRLVMSVLQTVHESGLRTSSEFSTLIPRDEVAGWVPYRFHPAAQRYFHPADNLGFMANLMESLAAGKELLFAIGAGIYLLWLRWKRLREKETQQLVDKQKEYLDSFLAATLRIETAQMHTTDVRQLENHLDEVTRIKLRALEELTEEDLRGDQTFSIFLSQCSSLINKIQIRILICTVLTPSENS